MAKKPNRAPAATIETAEPSNVIALHAPAVADDSALDSAIDLHCATPEWLSSGRLAATLAESGLDYESAFDATPAESHPGAWPSVAVWQAPAEPLPAAPVMPSIEEIVAQANAPAVAEPAYVLVIGSAEPDMITACVQAQMYAHKLGLTVSVHARTDSLGDAVRSFEPSKRGKRGDGSASAGVSAGPRGADWNSKTGQIVTLMLSASGATMDEMRAVTGWTFGAKYVRQIERSFGVTITVHDATARTKKIWRAEMRDAGATIDGSADDSGSADDMAEHDMDMAALAIAAE